MRAEKLPQFNFVLSQWQLQGKPVQIQELYIYVSLCGEKCPPPLKYTCASQISCGIIMFFSTEAI